MPASPQPANTTPAGDKPGGILPATELMRAMPGVYAAFLPRVPGESDQARQGAVGEALASQFAQGRGNGPPDHSPPRPHLLHQTHSADIHTPPPNGAGPQFLPGGRAVPEGDGWLEEAGHGGWLAVKTADCVPLLAVAPDAGLYAALHAGWRGTALGILPRLLERMPPGGAHIALGPHIRQCCFQVRQDCLALFDPAHLEGNVRPDPEHEDAFRLNLEGVLRQQALLAGVPQAQIHSGAHCTDCHRDGQGGAPYASHRRAVRAGGRATTSNLGLIGPASQA